MSIFAENYLIFIILDEYIETTGWKFTSWVQSNQRLLVHRYVDIMSCLPCGNVCIAFNTALHAQVCQRKICFMNIKKLRLIILNYLAKNRVGVYC